MQSLGNDFIVIDTITHNFLPSKDLISRIADRHFGIGCDQVLLLHRSNLSISDVDFVYQIFNADGSEAYQCGNGVRCLAKFVKIQGISDKEQLIFATKTIKTKTLLKNNGLVTAVTVGPSFEPKNIPIMAEVQSLRYSLQLATGEKIKIGAVSIGNPHAIILVDDITTAPVEILGPLISNHKIFPEQANVNFMRVLDSGLIELRVYERGSGETLACGSGACASVVVGRLWGFLDSKVVVKLCGGNLFVEWSEVGNNIAVTGPVEQVFMGEIIYEKKEC
jgi:diaminopimelate epimerase